MATGYHCKDVRKDILNKKGEAGLASELYRPAGLTIYSYHICSVRTYVLAYSDTKRSMGNYQKLF